MVVENGSHGSTAHLTAIVGLRIVVVNWKGKVESDTRCLLLLLVPHAQIRCVNQRTKGGNSGNEAKSMMAVSKLNKIFKASDGLPHEVSSFAFFVTLLRQPCRALPR